MELEREDYDLEDKHFDYFVKCFKGWSGYLGINDWMVDFTFHDNDNDDYRAMTFIHCPDNRMAEIILSDSWDIDPTEYSVSKIAFHESLELLFADISIMAGKREYSEEAFDRERHRVIRLLEGALFNRTWNNGYNILDFQSESQSIDTKRQEVSEIHNLETVSDSWVQRIKSKSRRLVDRLSPF